MQITVGVKKVAKYTSAPPGELAVWHMEIRQPPEAKSILHRISPKYVCAVQGLGVFRGILRLGEGQKASEGLGLGLGLALKLDPNLFPSLSSLGLLYAISDLHHQFKQSRHKWPQRGGRCDMGKGE